MSVCEIIVNLVLAFVGVVGALWYENLGVPRLIIEKADTTDDIKPNKRRTRFLRLTVKNNPRKVCFVPRQTASAVHGSITFKNNNGKKITGAMPIRWDGAPEPIRYVVVNGQVQHLPDPRLIRVSKFIDIYPDEMESLALAIKIQGDNVAYGWTSASYFHNWRHIDFELPEGDYIACVSVKCGDDTIVQDIRFSNPKTFTGFDLL